MCVPACPEQAKRVGVAGFVSVNEGLNLLDVCSFFLLFFRLWHFIIDLKGCHKKK